MGWAVRALAWAMVVGGAACEGANPFLTPEDVARVEAPDAAEATDVGEPPDAGLDAEDSDVADEAAMADDAGKEEPDATLAVSDAGAPDDVVFSTCLAADIGSALGSAVATGDTADGTFEYYDGCGGELALESSVTWKAPATGDYRFSTEGSAFDTLLYVRVGGCEGASLACNDNTPEDPNALWSSATLRLRGGERVAVFIDGFGLEGGEWTLSIDRLGDALDSGAGDVPADVPAE